MHTPQIASGALAQNLFTFFLTRGKKFGSILTIGAIPKPYTASDITYTPVTSESYVGSTLSLLPCHRKLTEELFSGKSRCPPSGSRGPLSRCRSGLRSTLERLWFVIF